MKKQKDIFSILVLFLGCMLPTIMFSQINEAIEPEIKGGDVIDLLEGDILASSAFLNISIYLHETTI